MQTDPDVTSTAARPLGWGGFVLQLLTVAVAYIAGSVVPVLALGQTSTGLALSAASGMTGGLVVAWLWLRRDRAVAAAFNLSRPPSWRRVVLVAIAAALAIRLWFQLGSRLVEALGLPSLDTGLVMDLVTADLAALLLWLVLVAWFAAGFGEEMLWRGFLMDRLMRLPAFGGRTWTVIGLQAVLFGLPHLWQGWSGVVITSVIGVFLGWLRLQQRGNLWALILAHGLVDTSSMVLGYLSRHALLPW